MAVLGLDASVPGEGGMGPNPLCEPETLREKLSEVMSSDWVRAETDLPACAFVWLADAWRTFSWMIGSESRLDASDSARGVGAELYMIVSKIQ